ncbi:10107_t:CDS:2, partial [Funneliformis geosporum]
SFTHELGICDGERYIAIKEDCSTSVPGLFAAGDVARINQNKIKQIVTAIAEGAIAAQSVIKSSPDYQGENLKEFIEKIRMDNNFAQKYGNLGAVYGVPFNIASYSLLTSLLAQVCGYKPGEFIHIIGDAHIYLNHIKQVQAQLKREPQKLPTLKLNSEIKSLFDFRFEDI